MVTVECRKCGNHHQAAVDDVIKGIVCPSCRAMLRLDDGSAVSIYEIEEKHDSVECPSCSAKFPVPDNPHEPLFCCPSCRQAFLRKPLPDFSAIRSSWGSPEIVRMLEEMSHEHLRQDDEQPLSYSARVLAMLRVKATEDIGDRLYPLLQAVFHMAERELRRLYCNYHLLPTELRLRLAASLAVSPLLCKFALGGDLSRTETASWVKAVVQDDLVYEQLAVTPVRRHYMVISTYVMEFVMQHYGRKVDRETLNLLSLTAIAHGLEEEICDSGYFVYLPDEDMVRPTTDLNLFGRREFYAKDDAINRELHRICTEWGMRRLIRWRRLLWLFLLLLLAMMFLGFIIHYQGEIF